MKPTLGGNRPKLYLAGPIAGLTLDQANSWRAQCVELMPWAHHLTPLRGKDCLKDAGPISNVPYDHSVLTTSKGVTRRDHWDCTRADAVLVNLSGAKKVSIGTVMEIAFAYDHRVPTVVVMEEGNVHEHIMLREAAHYVVPTLFEAVKVLEWLFEVR